MSDSKANPYAQSQKATSDLHKREGEREFGLALARQAKDVIYGTEIHHEGSYVSSVLRGVPDDQRLVLYMAEHREKIRTAIGGALDSVEFTRDRPVIVRLMTAAGDHPLENAEMMERIESASQNMQRVSIVSIPEQEEEAGEILFEQLPIEAYCFKADESSSQRGKFTAYIVDLVPFDIENDTLRVMRHPDITAVGLLSKLESATSNRLSDGESAKFAWKQALIEIPASTSRLTRYEMEDPSLEKMRQASVLSGRKVVEDFIKRERQTMSLRPIVDINVKASEG